MINDTVFRRFANFPIQEMPLDEFWWRVGSNSHLYVQTQQEYDYWAGMQIIEGKSFHLFFDHQEEDNRRTSKHNLISTVRYYTFDPVNKP